MKNKEARKILQRTYNNLARAVNAASDLEVLFSNEKDVRVKRAEKAVDLIMRAQQILNRLAEDDDIGLI